MARSVGIQEICLGKKKYHSPQKKPDMVSCQDFFDIEFIPCRMIDLQYSFIEKIELVSKITKTFTTMGDQDVNLIKIVYKIRRDENMVSSFEMTCEINPDLYQRLSRERNPAICHYKPIVIGNDNDGNCNKSEHKRIGCDVYDEIEADWCLLMDKGWEMIKRVERGYKFKKIIKILKRCRRQIVNDHPDSKRPVRIGLKAFFDGNVAAVPRKKCSRHIDGKVKKFRRH